MTSVAWILHLAWTVAFSHDFAAPPTRRPEVFSTVDCELALGLAPAQWGTYSGLGASLSSTGLLSGAGPQVRFLQAPACVLKSCAGH